MVASVQSKYAVKIHLDIVETGRNKSHHRNVPGGATGGALGHAKSFLESALGAKCSQGDSVQEDC